MKIIQRIKPDDATAIIAFRIQTAIRSPRIDYIIYVNSSQYRKAHGLSLYYGYPTYADSRPATRIEASRYTAYLKGDNAPQAIHTNSIHKLADYIQSLEAYPQ